MLVLSRRVGEKILIGDDITITIVRVAQGTVRVGVDAPRDMAVIRQEVADSMKRLHENDASSESPDTP